MTMPDQTQTALFSAETTPTQNGHSTTITQPEDEERPGYQFVKRIGWIPDDWTAETVGQALDIENHLREPISVSERRDIEGPYPYYGPTGVLDHIDHYRVDGEYALIGEDGDHFLKYRDRPMTLKVEGRFNVNNHAHIVAGTEKCTRDWFYYFYNRRSVRHLLTRQGAGRYKLTKGALIQLPIAFPPLPEQREIARVLGAWDRALADLDALLDAKRERAKGLAQRLLTGRTRLPGFGTDVMRATNIGPVPADWAPVRFGKVFAKRSEKNAGSEIDHVITVGKYAIRPQSEHFDKSVASADRSGYNVIRPGDFVYDPMSAYYGAIGRYDSDRPGIVSPVYRVLTLRKGFDSGFVKHLLDAHYVRHRIASYSTQGNKEGKRRGLQHSAFNAIPVYAPSEDEQREIAAVLDAAGAEVAALEDQRAALARQKKGLMQRLLTGEVRVTPSPDA